MIILYFTMFYFLNVLIKVFVFFRKPRPYPCFDYILNWHLFMIVMSAALINNSFLLQNTLAIFQMAH